MCTQQPSSPLAKPRGQGGRENSGEVEEACTEEGWSVLPRGGGRQEEDRSSQKVVSNTASPPAALPCSKSPKDHNCSWNPGFQRKNPAPD